MFYEDEVTPMPLTSEGIPTDANVVFLGVYEVDRHYGGREEGGWYYDTARYKDRSEPIVSSEVYPGQDAAVSDRRAQILAEYTDEQPRYPLSSVLSDGPEIQILLEDQPGDQESIGRQHYE